MPISQYTSLLSTSKPNISRYIGYTPATKSTMDPLRWLAGMPTLEEIEVEPGPATGSTPDSSGDEFNDKLWGSGDITESTPGPGPGPGPGPDPVKPPTQKVRKKFSSQMSPEALIAALMSELGFSPEETSQTSTSRYNPVDAGTPTLGIRGTPGDKWVGWLNAMLEDKKRKESIMSKTMSKTMSNRSLR
jgi:hypothetical protein